MKITGKDPTAEKMMVEQEPSEVKKIVEQDLSDKKKGAVRDLIALQKTAEWNLSDETNPVVGRHPEIGQTETEGMIDLIQEEMVVLI